MNLSNCDVMLFVGCMTANDKGTSLVHAAVDAGAEAAIGFRTIIYCEQANEWTKGFFSEYIEHEVAYYAAHTACENICKKYPNSPHGINSIEVIDTTED